MIGNSMDMDEDSIDLDKYDEYTQRFDPLQTDRGPRRSRKPQSRIEAQHTQRQAVAELAEPVGLEAGFVTTYQPARYETEWLLSSVRMFYDEHLISDVLAQIKGGKEASVYRCAADPTTGVALLAAKIYRPRMFRNLRNDKAYREGRAILTADGRPAKKTDHRLMRAIGKKTAFGVQVQHTSWVMHEYTTIERLYQAGAAVPPPIAAAENAILMGYCGDERRAAPALNEISLRPAEARPLLEDVLHNIELLLQHNLIHGDLSAYNLLYWQGRVVMIDFPQVVDVQSNSNAEGILRRDITRVCEYFARQGVRCNPAAIMDDLWTRYGAVASEALEADLLDADTLTR
jgi:RIO kinase 1